MGLRPSWEFAELLLDHRAGTIFYSAADYGAVPPEMRGKSESGVHNGLSQQRT
jgi:hypothetical protein